MIRIGQWAVGQLTILLTVIAVFEILLSVMAPVGPMNDTSELANVLDLIYCTAGPSQLGPFPGPKWATEEAGNPGSDKLQ